MRGQRTEKNTLAFKTGALAGCRPENSGRPCNLPLHVPQHMIAPGSAAGVRH
jgi:hypothetical protein